MPDQLVNAEVGVSAVRQADRAGRPADLLHGNAVVHVAEPHPTILLWGGEAVEIEIAHELPEVDVLGEMFGGVDGGGVRGDGLLRELVHALLELLLGVVEEEGGGGGVEAPREPVPSAEDPREPALRRGHGVGSPRLAPLHRKEEEG